MEKKEREYDHQIARIEEKHAQQIRQTEKSKPPVEEANKITSMENQFKQLMEVVKNVQQSPAQSVSSVSGPNVTDLQQKLVQYKQKHKEVQKQSQVLTMQLVSHQEKL